MKKVSAVEMRNTTGGISIILAGIALYVGANVGIGARISYEHLRYGKCKTYKKHCNKCKKK